MMPGMLESVSAARKNQFAKLSETVCSPLAIRGKAEPRTTVIYPLTIVAIAKGAMSTEYIGAQDTREFYKNGDVLIEVYRDMETTELKSAFCAFLHIDLTESRGSSTVCQITTTKTRSFDEIQNAVLEAKADLSKVPVDLGDKVMVDIAPFLGVRGVSKGIYVTTTK